MRITETRAKKPRALPTERPIGPCRQHDTSLYNATNDTLDEQADRIMRLIEDELVHVKHLEHELDHHGMSPYKGRDNGLVLEEVTDASDDKPGPWDSTSQLMSLKKVREKLHNMYETTHKVFERDGNCPLLTPLTKCLAGALGPWVLNMAG